MKSDVNRNQPSGTGWPGGIAVTMLVAFLMCAFATPAACYTDPPPKGGFYVELGGREEPDAIGGEIGGYGYINDNVSARLGLALLASESFDDVFTGISAGMRFCLDAPLTPFVGFGVFGGWAREKVGAANDGVDNDGDGLVDETGEQKEVVSDVLASVYPEVGVHLWASDRTRLTLSGKYQVTTEGRDFDFWMFNVGMGFSFN